MKLAQIARLISGLTITIAALLGLAPMPHAMAASIDIAVFDFELDDDSAAAGLVAESSTDASQLAAVSSEIRHLLAESGRYRLVDVSAADAKPVRDHALWSCGCDAPIAAGLGAEQSLIGVVKRISRTEYVIGFQLKDARSGATIAARDTGLRMGANYAWSRGASRLIQDRLLESPPKPLNSSN